MADKLITDDSVPDTVITLDPSNNSKTDAQGNVEDGTIDIPANPVNLDQDKMPPATNVEIIDKTGSRIIDNPKPGDE